MQNRQITLHACISTEEALRLDGDAEVYEKA